MMVLRLLLFQVATTNSKGYRCQIPSSKPWQRRWGGIDRYTAQRYGNGYDSQLTVFTNGWLRGKMTDSGKYCSK